MNQLESRLAKNACNSGAKNSNPSSPSSRVRNWCATLSVAVSFCQGAQTRSGSITVNVTLNRAQTKDPRWQWETCDVLYNSDTMSSTQSSGPDCFVRSKNVVPRAAYLNRMKDLVRVKVQSSLQLRRKLEALRKPFGGEQHPTK
jgi:hypothetical protein